MKRILLGTLVILLVPFAILSLDVEGDCIIGDIDCNNNSGGGGGGNSPPSTSCDPCSSPNATQASDCSCTSPPTSCDPCPNPNATQAPDCSCTSPPSTSCDPCSNPNATQASDCSCTSPLTISVPSRLGNGFDENFVEFIEKGNVEYGTNFSTCRVNLWEDYVYFLAKNKILSSELVLAGAEYVVGGSGVNDLWDIHAKLNPLFTDRAKKRKILKDSLTLDAEETNEILRKLREHAELVSEQTGNEEEVKQKGQELDDYIIRTFGINITNSADLAAYKQAIEQWGSRKIQLECLCLYRKGLKNLEEEKKTRYENMCPAFYEEDKKALESGCDDLAGIDASGLKYKRILAYWAFIHTAIHDTMFMNEEFVFNEKMNFLNWYKGLDWDAVEEKFLGSGGGKAVFSPSPGGQVLYKFTEHKYQKRERSPPPEDKCIDPWIDEPYKNRFTTVTIGKPEGYFDSIYNPIIAGMMGDLIPKKNDEQKSHTNDVGDWAMCPSPIDDECRRMQCRDVERYIQGIPYNSQCDNPTPAAACIRKWLIMSTEEYSNTTQKMEKVERFLIDPWIPIGIDESDIIKDDKDYSNEGQDNRIWKAYDNLVKEFYTFPKKTYVLYHEPLGPALPGWFSNDLAKCGSTIPCVAALGYKKEAVDGTSILWWPPKLYPFDPEGAASILPDPEEIIKANQFKEGPLVKSAAVSHILDIGLLRRDFTLFLSIYAGHVYDFHYIFPRLAKKEALEYPPVGLGAYLTVLGETLEKLVEKQKGLGSGLGASQRGQWGKLLDRYVEDLIRTNVGYQKFHSDSSVACSSLDDDPSDDLDDDPSDGPDDDSSDDDFSGGGDGWASSSGRQNPLRTNRQQRSRSSGWRPSQSQNPTGTDKKQESGSGPIDFTSSGFVDLGFRESIRAIINEGKSASFKKGEGRFVMADQGGLNAKSSTNPDFANAVKRFQKNKVQREQERQHWEKTVGQTERGKRLKRTAQDFYESLLAPPSHGDGANSTMIGLNTVTKNSSVVSTPKTIKRNTNTSNFSAGGGSMGSGETVRGEDTMESKGTMRSERIAKRIAKSKGISKGYYCRDGYPCINGICNNGKNCIKRMTLAKEAKRLGISVNDLKILGKTAAAVNNRGHWKRFINSLGKERTLFDIVSLTYLRNYHKLVISRPSY